MKIKTLIKTLTIVTCSIATITLTAANATNSQFQHISLHQLQSLDKKIEDKLNHTITTFDVAIRQHIFLSLLKYLYNHIQQNYGKPSFKGSLFSILLKFNKISYIVLPKTLTGDIVIDLNREFEKTLRLNNYSLLNFVSTDYQRNYYLNLFLNLDNYSKNTQCSENKLVVGFITYLLLAYQHKQLQLSQQQVDSLLICYLLKHRNYYVYDYQLSTYSPDYRQYNIKTGLQFFKRWWYNKTYLDIMKTLKNNDPKKDKFKIGYILITKNGKPKEVKAYAGGLCGISTLFYQAVLRLPDILVIKRRPHSIWYNNLYGGKEKLGQDATISFAGTTLLLYNNTGSPIFIDPYTYNQGDRFITGLKFISLKPLTKREVRLYKKYGNCAVVKVGNKFGSKFIRTCYKQIK